MTTPPVTLEQLAAHLNITLPDAENGAADRAELQLHLDAATEAIENRVGPIVTQEISERGVVGRNGVLLLGKTPAVALVSLTGVSGAVEWGPEQVYLEANAGVLTRVHGASFPTGDYDVTYTAGRGLIDDVPASLKLAVLITAAHLFETQRGQGVQPRRFGTTPSAEDGKAGAPRGFALPRRALELISGEEAIAFA